MLKNLPLYSSGVFDDGDHFQTQTGPCFYQAVVAVERLVLDARLVIIHDSH